MKKIIILIFVTFLLFSCEKNNITKNNNIIKEKIYNSDKKDRVFGGTFEEVKKRDLDIIKNKEVKVEKIEKESKNEEKELEYKEIKNYNKINISRINEKFILENSFDKGEIFIDLGFSSDRKKLDKIIKLVKSISEKNKINTFTLHCNDLNFNNKEIILLQNLNIDLFFLDSNCGFKKREFKRTWYDEKKVINFLKETKKISEIHIGYINEDYFRKKDGVIEKSDRFSNNSKWEKIKM